METKALLFAIVGFLLGGLVVSLAAQSEGTDSTGSEMSMTQSSAVLAEATGDDFDAAFLDGMIEHHEGALEMAELAADRAEHAEIKQLAADIVRAQRREIETMQRWRDKWGYASHDAQH